MTAVVVGAGIAGLLAGRALAEAGVPTLVVEAASVLGGRLATRQTPKGAADIGAQFFTVRAPRFQRLVDGWLNDGLVVEWSRGFSSASGPPDDGFPRYIARHGMAALAASLARPLDVRFGCRVTAIAVDGPRWIVTLADGDTLEAAGVVLTPPLPVALPLVADVLPDAARSRLAAVRYRRTLSAVVAVEGSVLPPPGAIQRPNHRLAFVADNQRKGLANAPVLTIHASPDWSDDL
jgi:predicted NAD/FAD-dependent oxidoreductase